MFTAHPIPHGHRRDALVAGASLLLIAVLAGFANFAAFDPLIVPGDAVATASNARANGLLLQIGVTFMAIAAVVDIVAARSLAAVFNGVSRSVANTAAWFRVVYAATFLALIVRLAAATSAGARPLSALDAFETFHSTWQLALILFGFHLLLIAFLSWRSVFVPGMVAVLLAIAGLGYLGDGVATVMDPAFTAQFAKYTFVGEVALMAWLLIVGLRSPRGRRGGERPATLTFWERAATPTR